MSMVRHIVVWKLKEQADLRVKADNAQMLKRELEGLKSKIGEIRSLEVGVNFNPALDAYDLALVSEFDTRHDLDVYQNHPEHQRVIGILRQYRDLRIVVDYET